MAMITADTLEKILAVTTDIEQDLLIGLAQEMQRELDQEIIDNIKFIDFINVHGWNEVLTPYPLLGDHWAEIEAWLQETITGKYRTSGTRMAFEYEADAVLFRLRWL